eukprot:NODE_8069_length_714_cov_35.935702_g7450_i0.p1 GENE.NODE_8069_length_714_cov_35.935702_g7450_i0~~NODE_8069_length_714_cov_35.935702_g7450_i0.p1  ORF type:complete len:168 (+),score=18.04 NODE_8069_length_714_cov_35.935702_g7450_i0:109-612(+)
MMHYDFPNRRYRMDHLTLRGDLPRNASEIWLGNILYFYDWDNNTCFKLDLGFGLPVPNWFLVNSTQLKDTEWLERNDSYVETIHIIKSEPPILPFNYYAVAETGKAFREVAPDGNGKIVVLDFLDIIPGPQDPSLFVLPSIPCTSYSNGKLNYIFASSWAYIHSRLR